MEDDDPPAAADADAGFALVEEIFKAITEEDVCALGRCMQSARVTTVQQFEATYGESPLHFCVKLGGVSNLALVRCLLTSRLFDLTQRDSEGRTALEYTLANGELELTKELIRLETEDQDDATACYRMMKHNSLELFKLYLTLTQERSEADTFAALASAMVKMSVKNFDLAENLRLFVQWKLSDYGYRKLAGDWPGTKDPAEWKRHIEIVRECWQVIGRKYDTRLYDDIDDELLHRLHVLHNYLYFLRHRPFLDHLPMQQVVFYVAMFVSIFRQSEQFQDYRVVVNKRLVMDVLRMVHRQLVLVRAELESIEAELTAILQEQQQADAEKKDHLIGALLEKIKTLPNVPNKDHWIAETTKRLAQAKAGGGDEANNNHNNNKDALIKEMIRKIKAADKTHWTRQVQAIDEANRVRLTEAIRGRVPYAAHPANVAARLMAGWKKGRPVELIVAEIVADEGMRMGHLLRGKDRRIVRMVRKSYTKTKQVYSLHKLLFYCDQIPDEKASEDTITPVATMQRMVQVFGEAVKNTHNSPNLPGKFEPAMALFLSDQFPAMNKALREIISHSVSLKKLLLREGQERKLCRTLCQYLRSVTAHFQLLYVVALAGLRHSVYGLLRRCRTLEQQRSLLRYIGDTSETEQRQYECYKFTRKYFTDAQQRLGKLRDSAVGKLPQFHYLEQHMKVRLGIVVELDQYFRENDGMGYAEIRRACLAGTDLATVRRMLDWKLTMRWANKFFHRILSAWKPSHEQTMAISWIDQRLLEFNESNVAGLLHVITSAMDSIEAFEYIRQTRKLTEDLGIAERVDEDALQELNKRLQSYYDNVFLVESKWKIVSSFASARKLPLDRAIVSGLLRRDQDQLQALFDDRRQRLRFILDRHRLTDVDELVQHLFRLPPYALIAVEHLQLELCSILLTVGYFGDSFAYLQHRLPMIQGKNYRNFLAHDALSYNLLTDSSMEKIVLNAYVFAHTELRLFERRSDPNPVPVEDLCPYLPTLQDTHRWVGEQVQLLSAFRATLKKPCELNQMHRLAVVARGGEIGAQFCYNINVKYSSPAFHPLTVLVDPCRVELEPIVAYLGSYYAGFRDACGKVDYQKRAALAMGNYEAAYERSIGAGETTIPAELFDWPELLPNLRRTELFASMVAAANRHRILRALIEHGNERGVREMLPYFEGFRNTGDRGALGDALLYNQPSIARELLLPRTAEPHEAVLLLAVIIHWQDVFVHAMQQVTVDVSGLQFLLVTAAQARNYTAAVYLLEQDTFRPYLLPELCKAVCRRAAELGQEAILRHILEANPASLATNRDILAEIMNRAALRKRWKCVELLLDWDAPAETLFRRKSLATEASTFLTLVQFGCSRLLARVRSVQNRYTHEETLHPLTVAVRFGKVHARMIRQLVRLGLDWLDSPAILHEAIKQRDKGTLALIWDRIDAFDRLERAADDPITAEACQVLKRWKMISFVEEPGPVHTTLECAVVNNDAELVRALLDRARTMRQLAGTLGNLAEIVFQDSSHLQSRLQQPYRDKIRHACTHMIARLEFCATMELPWQEFIFEAGVPVRFLLHDPTEQTMGTATPATDAIDMGSSRPLVDSLGDFLTLARELFEEAEIITGQVLLRDGTKRCFWMVEEFSCAYDLHPPGTASDLSRTVNYRDARGETPLHRCLPAVDWSIVRMLVEAGANPLLAAPGGMAPIHLSLWNSQDYAIGRYFFDECLRRDLRNADGLSVLELEDGTGRNRLIHVAVMTGRQDIMQRWLALNADISLPNSIGLTPDRMCVALEVHNSVSPLQMLLDHDPSLLRTVDDKGKTLLHQAVQLETTTMLQLLLKYGPDLTTPYECTAICFALLLIKPQMAKCLLAHAVENGIRGITTIDEDDLVLLSLMCNDFELSKGLLEYELGHTMNEIDAADLPRIVPLLDEHATVSLRIPVGQYVRRNNLQEALNFLTHLQVLCVSLSDR